MSGTDGAGTVIPPAEIEVLVVDDDFRVAEIHARFVGRTPGFVVVGSVRTGTEALAAVTDLAPDLVLLDVHLPDLSGIEVLRRLRAAEQDVGVIVVTAAREADTVRSALRGGASDYLIKPFELPDLVSRLERFRDSLGVLGAGTAGQDDVDAVFGGRVETRTGGADLPKGLSGPTGEAVLRALAGDAELSASECAELVGLSRVTARRYLEHFVGTGRLTVRLRYGAGRPERRYRRG